MKRVINFRSFLIIFVTLVLSILLSVLASTQSALFIVIFIMIIAVLLVLSIIYIVRKKYVVTVTCLLAILLSAVTFFIVKDIVMTWGNDFVSKNYSVTGSVQSRKDYGNKVYIKLENVQFDGVSTNYRMNVVITKSDNSLLEFVSENDLLEFSTKVDINSLIDENGYVDSYYGRNFVKFSAAVNESDIDITIRQRNLLQQFRNSIKNTLISYLGIDNANIAYGMIFGDRTDLENNTKDYFSVSGLGHLLAVSGLHFGILSMFLLFVCKLLHLRKVTTFVVVVSIMFLYAYVADFTPSVVRAFVMILVASFTIINGQRRDTLNNLCLAGCVLLVINPLMLFNVGFLMTMGAVYGVVLFAGSISNFLQYRVKLPKNLAVAIATSLSAQMGATPVIMYYFGVVQVYSLISNVILMPIMMVVFILLLLGALLTSLVSVFGVLLHIANFGVELIDLVAFSVGNLPFATVPIYTLLVILLCYPLYFVISKYFILVHKARVIKVISVGLCIMLCFVGNSSIMHPNILINMDMEYSSASLIRTDSGDIFVGDFSPTKGLTQRLYNWKVKVIDYVLLECITEESVAKMLPQLRKFNVKKVFAPLTLGVTGVHLLIKNRIDFELFDTEKSTLLQLEQVEVKYVMDKANVAAYKFYIDDITMLVALGSTIDPKFSEDVHIVSIRTYKRELCEDRITISSFDDNLYSELHYSQDYLGAISFQYTTGKVYGLRKLQ